MSRAAAQVQIDWDGQPMALECQWLGAPDVDASRPLLVFLHEGLGSVAMWKDFPQQLCKAAHCRGLVYSRPGYGQSTPLAPGALWGLDFMERQATELLPAALAVLGVDAQAQPLWLLGHSDGASIAMLFAAAFPTQVAGLVALAPHWFVEEQTVASIAALQRPEAKAPLLERLARYHCEPKPMFEAWSRIWLDPVFRHWSIADRILRIGCPVFAVQGLDDEYGSLEQIRGIARVCSGARLLELAACGHSPHRDQTDSLILAICRFMNPKERDLL